VLPIRIPRDQRHDQAAYVAEREHDERLTDQERVLKNGAAHHPAEAEPVHPPDVVPHNVPR
jgi:hypothetical protein